MLKSIQLRNFQSHRNFELCLAPGITTIRGRTDAGKSAVLRALRWVSLNSLAGDSFIRHGAKFSFVSLVLQTERGEVRIVRKRGRQNLYKLDGRIFKSFGQTVPEPIAKLLQVNEINFQRQHDSPFWFAASAPEVSRQLNRVIDLSVIDSSLSYSAAVVRTARERTALSDHALVEKELALLIKSGTTRPERFKLLRDAYSRWRRTERDHSQLDGVLQQLDSYPLRRLEAQAGGSKALMEKADALRRLSAAVIRLGGIIQDYGHDLLLVRKLPDFSRLERSWERFNEAEQNHLRLLAILESLELDVETVELGERDLARLEAVLKKEKCPLCGRKN